MTHELVNDSVKIHQEAFGRYGNVNQYSIPVDFWESDLADEEEDMNIL